MEHEESTSVAQSEFTMNHNVLVWGAKSHFRRLPRLLQFLHLKTTQGCTQKRVKEI